MTDLINFSKPSERNAKMFYIIAEAIEEHPELHNQEYWFGNLEENDPNSMEMFVAGRNVSCGTSQCIAGWAIVFDGQLGGFQVDDSDEGFSDTEVLDSEGNRIFGNHSFIERGSKILGLSYDEGSRLFMSTNNEAYDWPNLLRDLGDGMEMEEALQKNYLL